MVSESQSQSGAHQDGPRSGAGDADGAQRAAADLGATVRAVLDGLGEWAAAASAGAAGTGAGSGGFVGGPQGWADAARSADGGGHTVSTCGVCPICLGLAAIARSHPQVLAHLSDAAQSLLSAVAAMAQPPAPGDPAASPGEPTDRAGDPGWRDEHGPAAGEQRIDVTD